MSGCLSRELTQAVFTGGLAHREDEGSQLHSVIHAWGHAPEGERVHHERVQIWRQVSGPNASISGPSGQGNPEYFPQGFVQLRFRTTDFHPWC